MADVNGSPSVKKRWTTVFVARTGNDNRSLPSSRRLENRQPHDSDSSQINGSTIDK